MLFYLQFDALRISANNNHFATVASASGSQGQVQDLANSMDDLQIQPLSFGPMRSRRHRARAAPFTVDKRKMKTGNQEGRII